VTDGWRRTEQGSPSTCLRYFATPRRRFILADTPVMCSTQEHGDRGLTAELVVVLVDAQGMTEQTQAFSRWPHCCGAQVALR